MEELLEKTEELTEKMGQETTEETTVEAAQQSQPETAALEQELEEAIRAGHYAPGDKLPSENQLCQHWYSQWRTAADWKLSRYTSLV